MRMSRRNVENRNLFESSRAYLENTVNNALDTAPLLKATKALIGTIGTVFTAALSVCTFGISNELNRYAHNNTEENRFSKFILPSVYLYFLKIMDPNANLAVKREPEPKNEIWISSAVAHPIFKKAKIISLKNNTFFKRHFVSRGCYALAGLVSIVTKVADLALGLLAAVLSIIPCLGRLEGINDFAFNQLGALSLVDDLCRAARGVMNPQQFLA